MNSGVDEDTLEAFKLIAGDGDLDERCRRILGTCRGEWLGISYDDGL